ncbi:MAG: lysylphosphatidylglycerol synthase transmembrane domain-containing protein, partial [Oscillospiraceae bacterium]
MKNKIKNFLKNGGLFCLLVVFTGFVLFQKGDLPAIARTLRQVKLPFLLVGIAAMIVFLLCDAKNTMTALSMFGNRVSYLSCLKYAFVGFFFSSITPSASGGQPMQIFYMHKNRIPLPHATLTLMTELAAFQLVAVSYALAGFFFGHKLLSKTAGPIYLLLIIGVICNSFVLILILTAIFSKRAAPAIMRGVTLLLQAFRFKNADAFEKKASELLLEYGSCAESFKHNKKTVLAILLVTCVQIAALHSVPYWVYRAFGLDSYSFFSVLALQSILFVCVSAIPLPGAVGASESGFILLF